MSGPLAYRRSMAELSDLTQQAKQAILERIVDLAPNVKIESHGRTVEALAEAYAWLERPAQPHGGGGTTVKSG